MSKAKFKYDQNLICVPNNIKHTAAHNNTCCPYPSKHATGPNILLFQFIYQIISTTTCLKSHRGEQEGSAICYILTGIYVIFSICRVKDVS